jgi:hypothetical protein
MGKRVTWSILCCIMLAAFNAVSQISTFPYSEGFESIRVPDLPPGWTSFEFKSDSASPHNSYVCVSVKGNSTIRQLTSPAFDFTSRIPDKLIFYERRSTTARNYRFEIRALTDGDRFDLVLAQFDTISTTSSYVQRIIDLTATGLQQKPNVRFRWQLLGDSTNNTGTLRIDDVSLTVLKGFDIGLTGLSVFPSKIFRGDSICLVATVKNYGTFEVPAFSVRFFLDDNADGSAEQNEQFSVQGGSSLAPGDSLTCGATQPPLPAGDRRFVAVVDFQHDEDRANDTARASVSVGFAQGDMIINEIMYAPEGDEPEWVELLNVSPDTINLKKWRISDSNVQTKSVISQSDVLVPPESYLVIAKDEHFFSLHPGVPALIAGFAALNNTTPDAVVVYDQSLQTIDSVLYQPDWGGKAGVSLERIDVHEQSTAKSNWSGSCDPLGSTPGRTNSVARLDYDLTIGNLVQTQTAVAGKNVPVVSATVWNIGRRAVDSLTVRFYADSNGNDVPDSSELLRSISSTQSIASKDSILVTESFPELVSGEMNLIALVDSRRDQRQANNQASLSMMIGYGLHSLVINEIMYEPLDGQNEWIELYNRGTTGVNLSGWSFSDRPTASGNANIFPISSISLNVQPGEYLVIAADSTLFRLFPILAVFRGHQRICILNRGGGFSFNNDGDAIVLKDMTGRVIDSVAYMPQWHHPGVVDTRGRSLERINPDIDSNDPRNWSTCANIQGGTPACANSVMTKSAAGGSALTLSPNPFSPDGDGHEDFCIIRYRLPMMTSTISVRIYDIKGRLIRTLANGEVAGYQGEIVWDGLDDYKQRARVGVYVIFLEASDRASGRVVTAKAVAVVATRL